VTRARFIAPARREFLLEIAYYTAIEPGLGVRFASRVQEAVARAVAFPLSGSPASANTRRLFVQEFPFALIYRADERGIVIFALAHHSRRPEYWQPRVQQP
jgi:plasmid stabilization system protein ParE